MQRVIADGRLDVQFKAGRTRLSNLFQEGSAKIRFPRREDHSLEAVLINTAGGMTGGDRLNWQLSAGAGTRLVATTQACEKVYRTDAGAAKVDISMRVGAGASLHWLPQETILYDESTLVRSIEVDLEGDSSLVMLESVLFGRRAMGETTISASLTDRWRIRRDGVLLHAENVRLFDRSGELLARAPVGNGNTAFATLIAIGGKAELQAAKLRDTIGAAGSVSCWNGKLLARLAARDGYHLRQVLLPALAVLNDKAALPMVWAT